MRPSTPGASPACTQTSVAPRDCASRARRTTSSSPRKYASSERCPRANAQNRHAFTHALVKLMLRFTT